MSHHLFVVHRKVCGENHENAIHANALGFRGVEDCALGGQVVDAGNDWNTPTYRFYHYLNGPFLTRPIEISPFPRATQRCKAMNSLSDEVVDQIGKDVFLEAALVIKRRNQIGENPGKMFFLHLICQSPPSINHTSPRFLEDLPQ